MNYVLDSDVISELRKGARCNFRVMDWYRKEAVNTSYLSVMTLGEIRKGVESSRVKDPQKSKILEKWLNDTQKAFEERILPVTLEIADLWGKFVHRGDVAAVDGLIAATAAHHGFTVSTRNTRDFQRCGVDFVNPFEYEE